jgi:hypothetical protein
MSTARASELIRKGGGELLLLMAVVEGMRFKRAIARELNARRFGPRAASTDAGPTSPASRTPADAALTAHAA